MLDSGTLGDLSDYRVCIPHSGFKLELACAAKREANNGRGLINVGLTVAMETQVVVLVPVQVDQQLVELHATRGAGKCHEMA